MYSHTDRSSVDQLLFWLHKTLDGKHKVLEALINHAEREYDRREIKESGDNFPGDIEQMIDKAVYMCWDVWRETYRDGSGKKPEKREDRELLRHSGRLLNFSRQIIEDLLAHSRKQQYGSWRLQTAERAERFCSRFIGSLVYADGKSQGHHPSGALWLRLHATCKRRIIELWQESARLDEQRARNLGVSYCIPTKLVGVDKDNNSQLWLYPSQFPFSLSKPDAFKKLGFSDPLSTSADGMWQEVYPPSGCFLEAKSSGGKQRLFNSHGHLIATVITPEDGTQPYLLVEFEPKTIC